MKKHFKMILFRLCLSLKKEEGKFLRQLHAFLSGHFENILKVEAQPTQKTTAYNTRNENMQR